MEVTTWEVGKRLLWASGRWGSGMRLTMHRTVPLPPNDLALIVSSAEVENLWHGSICSLGLKYCLKNFTICF